jgi:hypothetical protein
LNYFNLIRETSVMALYKHPAIVRVVLKPKRSATSEPKNSPWQERMLLMLVNAVAWPCSDTTRLSAPSQFAGVNELNKHAAVSGVHSRDTKAVGYIGNSVMT